jgi:hypothetical protein
VVTKTEADIAAEVAEAEVAKENSPEDKTILPYIGMARMSLRAIPSQERLKVAWKTWIELERSVEAVMATEVAEVQIISITMLIDPRLLWMHTRRSSSGI